MDRFDWLELDGGFGDTEEAVPAQSRVRPRVRPHDGPTYYRAGREMREAGHFRAAALFYEKAVGFDEHHYVAWVELCDTLVRAKQLGLAEEKSAAAVDGYRQVRSLYAVRALVLAHQGNFREAYEFSDVGLEGEEKSWYAHCVRAEILLRQDVGQREQALGFLEAAADLAESPWEVYFVGGWMLLDAALPALAAGYFGEAAKCNPRAPIGWLCLGDCFRELRLYDQALFYYQRVVELEPSNELALERQKQCGPKLFGLTRVFRRHTLQERWKKEFDKLVEHWEPGPDDF